MSDTTTSTPGAAPVRARRTRAEAPMLPANDPGPAAAPAAPHPDLPPGVTINDEGVVLINGKPRRSFGSVTEYLDGAGRPGFKRHWFNDVPGRIKMAREAGYNHILDEEGKPMSRVVGTKEGGGELTAYRMEIPEEWYMQDRKLVDERVDEIQNQMQRGVQKDGQYQPTDGAGRPRTKITTGTAKG